MKILIAGGGTAGHINPGIAIAKYIQKECKDSQILFVGTKKGLEAKLVPLEGYKLELIKVRGFKRKVSLDTIKAFYEMFEGTLQARRIIKKFKPDIVIGTGGYVCGPVLLNASIMKIPTLIHEQNAFPGITNKILSRFVDCVAISFNESKKYFSHAKEVVLTGNPIKSEMLLIDRTVLKKLPDFHNDNPVVLIFGGSRGAEVINKVVCDMIKNYIKDNDCNMIFATGESQFENISNKLKDLNKTNIKLVPYIYNMSEIMAAADLAITRAGAITVSELAAIGLPAILIPSPYVTANHQEFNAKVLEKEAAAVLIKEKDLNEEKLYKEIINLIKDKNKLSNMSKNAKKVGVLNAAEKIYKIIETLVN